MTKLHIKVKKKKLWGSIEAEIIIEADTVEDVIKINKQGKLDVS